MPLCRIIIHRIQQRTTCKRDLKQFFDVRNECRKYFTINRRRKIINNSKAKYWLNVSKCFLLGTKKYRREESNKKEKALNDFCCCNFNLRRGFIATVFCRDIARAILSSKWRTDIVSFREWLTRDSPKTTTMFVCRKRRELSPPEVGAKF